MKKVIIGLTLLLVFLSSAFSQSHDKQCYYGISFQTSGNKNWGYGELIITDVEPNSPAEAAGIKVNDIIMEIDGQATYLRDNVTIASWLFDNPDPVVKFTIRNIDTYFKEYTLNRRCVTVNSVDESYLANIFSLYSLENSRQQNFTLPLKVNPTPDVDYTDYHTFAFYDDGTDAPQIDTELKAILEQNLNQIGLKKDTSDPDIWISLYYEFYPNLNYVGIKDPSISPYSERFNTATQQMEKFPILDFKVKNVNVKSPLVVKLGFTFFEKKYINTEEFTQIWECNIQDYLSESIPLEKYAKLHIPLMMMQYPASTARDDSKYYVSFNKYNYLGIHFDADQMNLVNDVDPNSPAFEAGIRPGYKINKVNDKKFDYTIDQLSEAYKEFITDTDKCRDQNSSFLGVEGYNYKFWDPAQYANIEKVFKDPKYLTNFSYLFDFEKYVNSKSTGMVNIELWDGMQKRVFSIKPQLRRSTIIKAL